MSSMHWTMLTWAIERVFTLKKAADSTCTNSNCWQAGRYDQFNSFNKLSPPYARSSLFSLGFTNVSLFLRVCVCARVCSREWEYCVCVYVCAFSYLWAIPHRAFSAGKDVLVWVMGVGLVLSKTLQPPRVSSTVLKLRCKNGWFA